jgi:hypothetical protein
MAKKASPAQLLARAAFAAKYGGGKGKRKAAKTRKAGKRKAGKRSKRKAGKRKAGKRRTKKTTKTKRSNYLAHKGQLYQCLGPIRRGCGGGAAVVVK